MKISISHVKGGYFKKTGTCSLWDFFFLFLKSGSHLDVIQMIGSFFPVSKIFEFLQPKLSGVLVSLNTIKAALPAENKYVSFFLLPGQQVPTA